MNGVNFITGVFIFAAFLLGLFSAVLMTIWMLGQKDSGKEGEK